MPKFTFHMGVDVRAYGNVEVEAATVDAAVLLLSPDYVAENISPGDITWDHVSSMAIIDATGPDDVSIDDWGGIDLPDDAKALAALVAHGLACLAPDEPEAA